MANACVPNIGPKERMKRSFFGLVMLAASVIVAVWLYHSTRVVRAAIFFPIFMSAIGLVQAKEQTCVAFAGRNVRNLDSGAETISNPSDLAQIAIQARKVYVQVIVAAALATAIFVLLPVNR